MEEGEEGIVPRKGILELPGKRASCQSLMKGMLQSEDLGRVGGGRQGGGQQLLDKWVGMLQSALVLTVAQNPQQLATNHKTMT